MSFFNVIRDKASRLVDEFRAPSPVLSSQVDSPQPPPRSVLPCAERRTSWELVEADLAGADPPSPSVAALVTTPSQSRSRTTLVPVRSVSPTPSGQISGPVIQPMIGNNSSNVNHNAPGGTIVNNNNNFTQVFSRGQLETDLNTIEEGLGQVHVSRAVYDAQPLTAGCTRGTRVQLLEKAQKLLTSRSGPHIIWIAGMAGTGKTSIALTLCRRLVAEPTVLLGGTFFCSRSAGMIDQTDAKRIIPTLVILLARQLPEYARAVAAELEKDPDLASKITSVQVERLLLKPLESMGGLKRQLVFVIDALDECRNQTTLAELIDALADFSTTTSVKFLLTSRPEVHIRETAITDKSLSSIVQLHMVDEALVTSDIRLYIQKTLENSSKPSCWYTDRDIDDLAALSAGLFIFASTVLAYILRRKDGPGRSERLRTVKLQASASAIATDPLDKMYSLVLMQASDPTTYEPTELDETRRIVAVILSTRSPLTVKALAELLGLSTEHLRGALDELHAVIFVPEQDEEGELRTLHASFGDFIFTRAATHIRIERSLGHDELARACLQRMAEDDLCFNVSRSQSSYKPNPKAKPTWVAHSLVYACCSWAHHIALASEKSLFDDTVYQIFLLKLLFWLEVLSIMGEVDRASDMLDLAAKVVTSPDTSQFLRDSASFVTFSRKAIERSAPHIYLSALAFAPKSSLVHTTFYSYATGLPEIEIFGVDSSSSDSIICAPSAGGGGSLALPMDGHTDRVNAIALSRDGRVIVSASADGSIRVWDSQTRQQMYPPLMCNERGVYSVALSLDGRWIAIGSQDRTVRLWNAQTGEPAKPDLYGHTDVVNAVSFSPDGLYLASASEDKTVRIWEVATGQPATIPLIQCNQRVRAIGYSPSGSSIIIGSSQGQVQTFDSATGRKIGGFRASGGSYISPPVFSPDGAQVVTSSGAAVCIFDVYTGRPVGSLQGHTSPVFAATYSPGQLIASAASDWTVRLWDPHTNECTEPVLYGHAGAVSSIACSSDGGLLVTGSDDKTIRLWDLEKVGQMAAEWRNNPLASLISASYEKDRDLSQTDGWLVSPSGHFLLWVPLEYRGCLEIGGHSRVIATNRAAVTAKDGLLHQGDQWTQCWRAHVAPDS